MAMLRIISIVLLVTLGGAAGLWLGFRFAPPNTSETGPDLAAESSAEGAIGDGREASAPEQALQADAPGMTSDQIEYVRLSDQFVVPILRQGSVNALVVVSIGLEVQAGLKAFVFAREPKLRDAFLQVLFAHANAGGFDGAFTSGPAVEDLRQRLLEAGRPVLGSELFDVLITDLARQDT